MSELKRRVRIGPLNTVGGVVTELGRVYRKSQRGEMELSDATRLTCVLRELRCALEAGDIERRLDELEAAAPAVRGVKLHAV